MMWHWPSTFADEHFPLPTVAKLGLLSVVSSTSGNDRIEKCRNIKTGVGHELHSTLADLFINTLVNLEINKERESIKWRRNGALLLLFTVLFRGNHSRSDSLYLADYILYIHDPALSLHSFQLHCYVYLTFSHMYSVLLLLSFMPRFWCYYMMV